LQHISHMASLELVHSLTSLLTYFVTSCIAEKYRLLYVFMGLILRVTPATKLTKFGSIYLGKGLSERDKIFASTLLEGVGVRLHTDR